MSDSSYSIILKDKESAIAYKEFVEKLEKPFSSSSMLSLGLHQGAMVAKKDLITKVTMKGEVIPKGTVFVNFMIGRSDLYNVILNEFNMEYFGESFDLEDFHTRKRKNENSYQVLNMKYLESKIGAKDITPNEIISLFD